MLLPKVRFEGVTRVMNEFVSAARENAGLVTVPDVYKRQVIHRAREFGIIPAARQDKQVGPFTGLVPGEQVDVVAVQVTVRGIRRSRREAWLLYTARGV